MNMLDPRYVIEAQRLLDQLRARGVYAPRLLLDMLTQSPAVAASDILEEFDHQQVRAELNLPRSASHVGAAIYATRRAILTRWPDPPAAEIPI